MMHRVHIFLLKASSSLTVRGPLTSRLDASLYLASTYFPNHRFFGFSSATGGDVIGAAAARAAPDFAVADDDPLPALAAGTFAPGAACAGAGPPFPPSLVVRLAFRCRPLLLVGVTPMPWPWW